MHYENLNDPPPTQKNRVWHCGFSNPSFARFLLSNFELTSLPPHHRNQRNSVNLEYLARVVFNNEGLLYPDSLVGTDSHTTMINGLGVLGWGVGGIEVIIIIIMMG